MSNNYIIPFAHKPSSVVTVAQDTVYNIPAGYYGRMIAHAVSSSYVLASGDLSWVTSSTSSQNESVEVWLIAGDSCSHTSSEATTSDSSTSVSIGTTIDARLPTGSFSATASIQVKGTALIELCPTACISAGVGEAVGTKSVSAGTISRTRMVVELYPIIT